MHTQPLRALRVLALVSPLVLAAACGDKDGGSDSGAVADTTAPVITLNGDDPLVVGYGETFTDPGATATDDTDAVVDVIVSGEVDTSVLGDVILSYDAVDSAGNEAETVTRTVTVADLAGPVITLVGDNPLIIAEGTTFEDPGATATDDVDGDVDVTVSGSVDANVAGSYILTYDAVDSAGNAAETVEREVQVQFQGQLAVAANGSALTLVGQRPDGTLVERATAQIDFGDAVYNDNHMIFGIAVHPDTGDIYTTSFNECGSMYWWENGGCWGNARVDRFSYGLNTLTHEGAALLLQGPVRFLEPVGDATSTEVVVPVMNQGPDALDITSVSLDGEETAVSLVSGCDAMTLAVGDTCELTFSVSEVTEIYAGFVVTTAIGDVYSSLYWNSDWEAYRVDTPSPEWSVELELPECASYTWGEPNQVGTCSPTALAISRDGSRMFINDDMDDIGLTLAIESDGSVSFLSEGDGVDWQGIAVNGDGSAVYNGGNAYSTTDDVITQEWSYDGGNATEVFELGGVEMLASTVRNRELAIFDLTTPLEPALVASVNPAEGRARYQHHSQDASRFVTIDHNDIVVYDFDGSDLTELYNSDITPVIDESACTECDYTAYNRVVQMSADGSQAMTGVFVNPWDEETAAAVAHGQVRSFDVDATTGEATEVDTLTLPGMTRMLLIVPPPVPVAE